MRRTVAGSAAGEGTDPLDPASSRFGVPGDLYLGNTAIMSKTASTADSGGNVHVGFYAKNNGSGNGSNDVADDLYVALYSPKTGTYTMTVKPTLITSHTGSDDRRPAIVTVPKTVGAAGLDRTILLNGTKSGVLFLTELDFGKAAQDGNASDTATLVVRSRKIDLPLGVQHPYARLGADGSTSGRASGPRRFSSRRRPSRRSSSST